MSSGCDAVTIHLGVSAVADSGCGFALAAIGMACKCRPERAAKRRNLKKEEGVVVKIGNFRLTLYSC